jgi:hypothetical protein
MKVRISLHIHTIPQRHIRNEGKAVCILITATIWRGCSLICFTPSESSPGFHWIGGWVGTRATLDMSWTQKVANCYIGITLDAVPYLSYIWYTLNSHSCEFHLDEFRYTHAISYTFYFFFCTQTTFRHVSWVSQSVIVCLPSSYHCLHSFMNFTVLPYLHVVNC